MSAEPTALRSILPGVIGAPLPPPDLPPKQILIALPPTADLQAALLEMIARPPAKIPRSRAAQALENARQHVEWGKARDALAAGRPGGCWCLGEGGRDRAYIAHDSPVTGWVRYCVCPEADAAREAVAQERARLSREFALARVEALWAGAGIPPLYRDFSFDSFPATAETKGLRAKMEAWLARLLAARGDEVKPWLLAWGSFGVGKSGLTVALLRRAAAAGLPILFANVADVLAEIQATWKASGEMHEGKTDAAIMEALSTTHLVALDDLGAERAAPWVLDRLYLIVNRRYNANLPTVVTTNLAPDELVDHVGERIAGRLLHRADRLQVAGPNLRER